MSAERTGTIADPKRWLDEPGLGADERRLLQDAPDVEPPPSAQLAVWTVLAAKLGGSVAGGAATASSTGAGAGATGGGATAASSTVAGAGTASAVGAGLPVGAAGGAAGLGAVKIAVLVLAIGGASVATYRAVGSSGSTEPRATGAAPASSGDAVRERAAADAGAVVTPAPATMPDAPAGPDERDAPAPVADPAGKASGSVSGKPVDAGGTKGASQEHASRLRLESQQIGRAREALRSGDPGGALRMLDDIAKQYPEGGMSQEREWLTIDALARSGNTAAAQARARAFARAYPDSPLVARLAPYLE